MAIQVPVPNATGAAGRWWNLVTKKLKEILSLENAHRALSDWMVGPVGDYHKRPPLLRCTTRRAFKVFNLKVKRSLSFGEDKLETVVPRNGQVKLSNLKIIIYELKNWLKLDKGSTERCVVTKLIVHGVYTVCAAHSVRADFAPGTDHRTDGSPDSLVGVPILSNWFFLSLWFCSSLNAISCFFIFKPSLLSIVNCFFDDLSCDRTKCISKFATRLALHKRSSSADSRTDNLLKLNIRIP